MAQEQTVFGMTLEEVGRLKKDVVAQWDEEHHTSECADFASALKRGSELLHADATFARYFREDWSDA